MTLAWTSETKERKTRAAENKQRLGLKRRWKFTFYRYSLLTALSTRFSSFAVSLPGIFYRVGVPRTIYFDYNATTPLDPGVREAMLPYLGEIWGNPSSVHHIGRKARALLDDARDRAARFLGAKPSEIIFTSGGTEANNLTIFGTARLLKGKGKHLITSAVEHHAGLHCFDYLEKHEGFAVTRLPVNAEGRVLVDALKAAFRPDTTLVSIMAANNEIGTLQPVAELGAACRERGIIFHTDAVQWFGKEPFDAIGQFNADLVSVCAHKFHGPKGAGLLYIKSPLHPDPIFFGGGHENERRAGTENLPAIIGLVTALEKFIKPPVFDRSQLKPLVEKLALTVENIDGCEIVSPREGCLANTLAFTVRGSDGIALMAGLDVEGICASSGSACSAGSLEPSHVIMALGKKETANSLVRFSLGRASSLEEVNFVCAVLPEVIRRAQRSK
jgi:cysteine desulfurase